MDSDSLLSPEVMASMSPRPAKRMMIMVEAPGDNSNNMAFTLWQRQTMGSTVIRPSLLSSRLSSQAWSLDRMHNLILAVGPGTPASVIYASRLRNRAFGGGGGGGSNEHSEDDDGDDDDDDDNRHDDQFVWTRLGHDAGEQEENDDNENEEQPEGLEEANENETDQEEEQEEQEGRSMDIFDALDQPEEPNDEEDGDDDNDDELEDPFLTAAERIRRQRDLAYEQQQQRSAGLRRPHWKHEIGHLGCINTACWLDVSWRLAAPAGAAVSQNSNEAVKLYTQQPDANISTQLATSGDDRVVKLWDARYAMGTASPIPGGWDTFCPFATTKRPHQFQAAWKKHYGEKYNDDEEGYQADGPRSPPAGSILPLCDVATGHGGNVFHVTPLEHHPGQLLTCAADGYLRCINVEQQSSSVIINPLAHISSNSYHETSFFLHSGLAFSHTLLTHNTGLLCSDRGLHLFDLRLSPREQARHSLLDNSGSGEDGSSVGSSNAMSEACKACAIWKPNGTGESSYVFAGGASAVVELLDLRMDGSRRRLVEAYKPRHMRRDLVGEVSVSGLDVSKDGRELLVSYESDQIYAFPILAQKGGASPTLEDIDACAEAQAVLASARGPVTEAMGYGGHLNRFTFLKNARYAGPHDEYVCTGSDSGHAWIFDRGTGTVVSLMSADSSTCNGVVPHKKLPFFITYGIESTARIWRATTPVDVTVDDSGQGRVLCAQSQKYEMSPVTSSHRVVQMLCGRFQAKSSRSGSNNNCLFLPDAVASRQEIASCGKFSAPNRRGMVDYDSPRIGNALQSLSSILRSNRYECYRTAYSAGSGMPVDKNGLRPFCCRVALCRLQQQATRLGIPTSKFPMSHPWNFGAAIVNREAEADDDEYAVHASELVPDHPSDWILLDERMNPTPLEVGYWHLNWSEWSDFLIARDKRLREFAKQEDREQNEPPVWLRSFQGKDDFLWPVRKELIKPKKGEEPKNNEEKNGNENEENTFARSDETLDKDDNSDENMNSDEEEDGSDAESQASPTPRFSDEAKTRSQRYLYETALLLKEGGNVAMKEGNLDAAARRYDKSIQYCSVAFIDYCEGPGRELAHLQEGLCVRGGDGKALSQRLDFSVIAVWSPLLRLLITVRLNLSLLLLKPRCANVTDARYQAQEALRLLEPFTVRPGAVVVRGFEEDKDGDSWLDGEESFVFEEEPAETYKQARALKAKAFFRLGSACMEQGDLDHAVRAFQSSVLCSEKPDSLVTRRLHEARSKHKAKKKRDRMRFEVALGSAGVEDDEGAKSDQKKSAAK